MSPAPAPSRWRIRLIVVFVAAVLLPTAASVLYSYPPAEGGFYPGCIFHTVTGLHCPGCGATRCCHVLLHGDLAQALAYNPLFVLALPLIVAGLLQMACGQWTGRPLRLLRFPPWAAYVLLWGLVAYWILRNIDVYPLTLLAPHVLTAP